VAGIGVKVVMNRFFIGKLEGKGPYEGLVYMGGEHCSGFEGTE
jgi:hypothetical protein